jgi:hypothetical protein
MSPRVVNQPSANAQSTGLSSSFPTQSQPNIWGEYHTNIPNTLILIDSQGRRTGKDPITGVLYREIPGVSYSEAGLSLTNRDSELFTSDLPNGRYILYVLGGQTTNYWLSMSHYGQSDRNGAIHSGEMAIYVQDYDAAHLASSTFSFAGLLSSTASITSAPPHNLPFP